MTNNSTREVIKDRNASFPSTRYQGSKRKIIEPIWDIVSGLNFDSALDLFGGTGAFAYQAKSSGKIVYYNDFLKFNQMVGRAIIENDDTKLTDQDISQLTSFHENIDYPSLIQDEFEGLYFKDRENEWLDKFRYNIRNHLHDEYKRAIAFSALSQACLAKRPYNLFHRANLNMRTRDVERSFGNKTTWEKPFEEHFRKFAEEYNSAVFSTNKSTRAYNKDAFSWKRPPSTDLVYIDPPYYDRESSSMTDYVLYYHFLDGYIRYNEWPEMIDYSVKTKAIERSREPWNHPKRIEAAFRDLFEKFSDRIVVMSYNTSSLPLPKDVAEILKEFKQDVEVHPLSHQYVLSPDSSNDELLIIGE